MMYGTLLRNYEAVKEDYSLIRKRYDDLVSSHSAAVNKLEHSQVRSIVILHIKSRLYKLYVFKLLGYINLHIKVGLNTQNVEIPIFALIRKSNSNINYLFIH